MINKDIKINHSNKIKRKNFFKSTGTALLGLAAVSSIPFNFVKSKPTEKVSSIKITQNPHAVKRNSRQDNNG